MNSDQPISPQLHVAFALSLVCLTSAACANNQPVVDTSKNTRAEFEATVKELRKSAEAGDAFAQNRLGLLYDEGAGVPQSHGQAKEWFGKAAKQGHTGAQANLVLLDLQGSGVPRSSRRAVFW